MSQDGAARPWSSQADRRWRRPRLARTTAESSPNVPVHASAGTSTNSAPSRSNQCDVRSKKAYMALVNTEAGWAWTVRR